MYMTFILII